ncbi:MAG: hypothetical protein CM15mP73_0730 [Hyphomicrobiales bacterium]|nr:MAG: hypothetical protein CM15mP73_0730 [Hyphomicrobiales bacterium]
MSVQIPFYSPKFLNLGAMNRKKYIPELIKGKLIGCFGLTEPIMGQTLQACKPRQKADNGWVLNGSKTWITNAPIADVAIVWAKTDDYDIQGFILDKNKHKFRTEKIVENSH